VIADYHFQPRLARQAIKESLGRVVQQLCEDLTYSCQVEGSTLRFRYNKWYAEALQEEPRAELLETWWKKIEDRTSLELSDLMDIARLPDKQMLWSGFYFMPGADQVWRNHIIMRVWGSLAPEMEAKARTQDGLPVSQLRRDQWERLLTWPRPKADPGDWSKGIIRISPITDRGVKAEEISFQVPGDEPDYRMRFCLGENPGKDMAARRKADMQGDKVEVVK